MNYNCGLYAAADMFLDILLMCLREKEVAFKTACVFLTRSVPLFPGHLINLSCRSVGVI